MSEPAAKRGPVARLATMIMNRHVAFVVAFALTSLASTRAWAQVAQDPGDAGAPTAGGAGPSPTQPPPSAGAEPAAPTQETRLRELEAESRRLRQELDELKEDHKSTSDRVDKLLPIANKFTGYIDFGFFGTTGNGAGIRNDTDYAYFPEYRTSGIAGQWVFYGDPLATMVNARGEPADTGPSRALTFDPIHNGGKPSFIVNSIDLALFHAVNESLTFNAAVDFIPRTRNVSIRGQNSKDLPGLGDFLDVKLGYAEYIVPTQGWSLSLFAGKFDSVLGVEYRTQDAPDRLAVTPSLICRYTCGRPLGLKARARFLDDRLALNVSVANGSNFVELFPFYNEIDSNNVKTVSGRVSYDLHIGKRFEAGFSGAYGAQDLQSDDGVPQWQTGADLSIDWKDIVLTAEWVHGIAQGAANIGDPPCATAPCLHFTGAYAQLGYRVLNWLTPYTRVDTRDAFHRDGTSFVYISQLMRVTGGAHFEVGTNVVVKAEYTHVQQLGRAPQFPNDVATSSLVLKF